MKADDRRRRTRTVAFKIDDEMAAFLAALPNASAFIRGAILAQFKMTCALCKGSGVVARGVGEHFAAAIADARSRACDTCGATEPIPADLDATPDADRPRWEQFFHGGPFFCAGCFAAVPACGKCAWRMTADLLAAHHRDAHRK